MNSKRKERVKRLLWISLGVVVFVAVLLRLTACNPGEPRPISIVVFDKTVPDLSYREHKALFEAIGSGYVDSETRRYFDPAVDYFGFVPLAGETWTLRPLPGRYDGVDIFYLADAYGVYTLDFFGKNIRGERSRKIHGGLTMPDIAEVQKAIDSGALLIAEFNSFASPTLNPPQEAFAKIIGVKWTGWIGRHFTNLSRNGEIPIWAVENFEKEKGERWNFTGPGYIFVRKDHIVVLLEGQDIEPEGCAFELTPRGEAVFPEAQGAGYRYWFDILELETGTVSLGDFRLKVTDAGRAVLDREGLPTRFPAVILNEATTYTSFYFAGDFADRDDRFIFLRSDRESLFYRRAYQPMMEAILDRVVTERAQRPVRFPVSPPGI